MTRARDLSDYKATYDKLGEIVSVTDHGAVGDGLTDNTTAFNATVQALPSTGGTIIVPPGGWWRVEGEVLIDRPVTFVGQGINNQTALIRTTNPSSTFFRVSAEGVSIRDMSITGKGKSATTAGTYAVETANSATRLTLDGLQISEVSCGLNLKCGLFSVRDVEVRDITPTTGVGAKINQFGLVDGVGQLDNLVVQSAGGASEPYAAVEMTHAVGIQVQNCDFMQAGGAVILAPTAGRLITSVSFVNTYFDTSDNGGLFMDGSVSEIQRIRVGDSWFAGSSAGSGLRCRGTIKGLVVTGSEFYDSINGILVENNTVFDAAIFAHNLFGGNATADISIGQNVTGFSLIGNRGPAGGFAASPVGAYINAGCSNFDAIDNRLPTFVDASGATAGKNIRGNAGHLFGSTTYDPPNLADGAGDTTTCACTGLALGDIVQATFSADLQGITVTAWCSSAGTASVRFQNETGGAIDLANGTLRVIGERRT